MRLRTRRHTYKSGFTLIELMVVIAIIALLATVSVLGYGAWRQSVLNAQIKSDLNAVASAMETARTFNNGYPSTLPATVNPSDGVTLTVQSATANEYCIDGTSTDDPSVAFYLSSELKDQGAQTGTCAVDRPSTTVPAVPTGLAITSASAAQITLSWSTASGASNYELQCASDAAFVTGLQQATSSGTTGTVTGLQAVNTHYCRIRATNAAGVSSYTAFVSTDTSALLPPTGFASTAVNDVSITFSWTANPDATSYTLQCATNAGFTTGLMQFNTASPPGQFNGLTALVTYYCHIRSVNSNNTSAWSSTVTTTTTATFGTIPAATNLLESSPGPISSMMTWTGITCSLGTPEYRFVWVTPYAGSATSWSATTSATVGYPQQNANTWKVESRCAYSGIYSSVTSSSNKSFTSVGTAAPTGAFGTIGWNGRFQFDTNANTYTCTSPATEQYQLVSTLINATTSTITYGWTGTTVMSVTSVNQGSRMTTYIQVRCLLNGIPSNTVDTSTRTDNASIDAPGSVPGWCAGTCGSPRGDRWSAVSCPAGTTAYYWSYAVGNYSNVIWGAYEAAGFYGYDRGYYSYGDTMVNDYLKARCASAYTTSAYGPQSYAYY